MCGEEAGYGERHREQGLPGAVGHQNPADQKRSGFLAELAQGLDKGPTEAPASEQASSAIGAGGDKLELAGLEMASVDGQVNDIGGGNAERESQS
jgi:hypothetical protein